ncbi:PH domain-containing protein [Gelidibacter japonicus]|uniref:PH domain-containing protein n=1 Tax=Gelidibacter japonicus TaxID=1962232 RepID=UPI00202206B7|nr:PH domain-containing protein [Gelidibacter japonicus]MCL8006122.1 PH domain-containing protein [Gelidibacter japonicus]
MKNYNSKSSFSVKLITIGIVIVMGIVVFSILTLNETYGIIGGIIISIIILSALIYFYANSLRNILIGENYLTLKKNIGKIEIPFSDIIKIEKLDFSNLSMTYGSKGVFGYVGNTMDDSISMVNDRKNMVRIITNDKKYTISSERPKDLINDIRNVLQQQE